MAKNQQLNQMFSSMGLRPVPTEPVVEEAEEVPVELPVKEKPQSDKVTKSQRGKKSKKPEMERVTVYVPEGFTDDLIALTAKFRKASGQKVNAQEVMRYILTTYANLKSLEGLKADSSERE